MRLSQIQAAVYARLLMPANPPPDVQVRILYSLNECYRQIMAMKTLHQLRRATVPFVAVAGSPYAVLPAAAVKVITVVDRVRNKLLDEMSLGEIRERDPGMNFSSTNPWGYAIMNYASPIAVDPTGGSALYITSTSPLDSPSLVVYIEGITSDGNLRTVVGQMNGVTPNVIGSDVTTWLQINKFYLSDSPAGFVSLSEGSGGTVLATLAPKRSFSRYTRLHFFGTPASADTYYADIEVRILDLVNDHDEPLIPEDFHWLLVSGVVKREYIRKEKAQQYGIEAGIYNEGLKGLVDFVRSPTFSNSRRRPPQFSQLGPWFEGGT